MNQKDNNSLGLGDVDAFRKGPTEIATSGSREGAEPLEKNRVGGRAGAIAALLLACSGLPAAASVETHGELRGTLSNTSSVPSWLDGGAGRFEKDGSGLDAQLHFGARWLGDDGWGGYLQVLGRAGDSVGSGQRLGLTEGYLQRQDFFGANRLRIRAGQYFLPVTLEAVDPLWSSPYTQTLSPLTSWIAEEFRPIGVDVSWQWNRDSGRSLDLAGSVFGGNDSAGALLAWRGFAWHRRLSVAGETLPLPPLGSLADPAIFGMQRDDGTRPFGADLDGRLGYALRLRYDNGSTLRINASAVDTRGDRELHRGEYAWQTIFTQLGIEWSPNANWVVTGEALHGSSRMGVLSGPHVDIAFNTAYLLLSRRWDRWRASIRADSFDITDRDLSIAERNDETGHAVTVALNYQATRNWMLQLEAITADSRRPGAVDDQLPVDGAGTALRFTAVWVFDSPSQGEP